MYIIIINYTYSHTHRLVAINRNDLSFTRTRTQVGKYHKTFQGTESGHGRFYRPGSHIYRIMYIYSYPHINIPTQAHSLRRYLLICVRTSFIYSCIFLYFYISIFMYLDIYGCPYTQLNILLLAIPIHTQSLGTPIRNGLSPKGSERLAQGPPSTQPSQTSSLNLL